MKTLKTPKELNIPPLLHSTLQRVRDDLRGGRIAHIREAVFNDEAYTALTHTFNMLVWAGGDCGTVHCIGGFCRLYEPSCEAELDYQRPRALSDLFYPTLPARLWDSITPAHAADAIDNYLTNGAADWEAVCKDLAVPQ